MHFGIRVVNLLPDPDTGWMWIQLGHWIRNQEENGVQKKIIIFIKLDVSLERLRFFLELGNPL